MNRICEAALAGAIGLALFAAQAPAAPRASSARFAEDARTIRALRAENNRAIAAKDLDGTMRIVGEDFVLVAGGGGIDRSAADDRKAWAEEFALPGYAGYVRTTIDLKIGEDRDVRRAAEAGTWEGLFHRPAGDARPFGRYFVHWSKASGAWRVVAETYVTLGCRGRGCR